MKPIDVLVQALAGAGCNPRGGSARCPRSENHSHSDASPSLTYDEGRNGGAVIKCHASDGCSFEAICAALHIDPHDLAPERAARGDDDWTPAGRADERYCYVDEGGRLLFEVMRIGYGPGKKIMQRRPDPTSRSGWAWKLGDVRRVLYGLPELIAGSKESRWIIVPEGERDCDTLRAAGFVATCNPGGAGKWRSEYDTYFTGAKVCILPDNDRAGHEHAAEIAAHLHAAAYLCVVELPGLAEHQDASDWLGRLGHTAVELRELILAAPEWTRGTTATDSPPRTPAGSQTADAPRARLSSRPASSITPTRPEWVWRHWLLARAVNLLVGRQGAGKTTFAVHLLAMLTTGRALHGDVAREAIRCAVLSLEEPEDRLVARLRAAGADLDQVLVLGTVEDHRADGPPHRRPWRLPDDVALLGEVVEREHLALVVVDGLGYSIAGDSHNYAVVGAALSALGAEAERTGAAVLGLTHPPKGASEAVTAAIGSTAWTALPRVCMVLGPDPSDETEARRVVRVSKSNYAMPEAGLSFTIAENAELEVGYVTGVAESSVRPNEITGPKPTPDERSEQSEIADVLRQLTENGPVAIEDARRVLREAGYRPSDSTLLRARRRAGLVATGPDGFRGPRSYHRQSSPVTPLSPITDGTGDGTGATCGFVSEASSPGTPPDGDGTGASDRSARRSRTVSDEMWTSIGYRLGTLPHDAPTHAWIVERGFAERDDLSPDELAELLAVLDAAEAPL